MLIKPTIDELETKVSDRYSLVHLASKRARDVLDGAPALAPVDCKSPISLAAKEIDEGLIRARYLDSSEE